MLNDGNSPSGSQGGLTMPVELLYVLSSYGAAHETRKRAQLPPMLRFFFLD